MRFWFKFAALGAGERALRLRALRALWGFRLALWTLPFPRLQTHLGRISARSKPSHSPAQIAHAISATVRFVPRPTCLVQSLATQFLLRREGFSSHLHVGVVKRGAQGFAAHAWVECGGVVVVGDKELDSYTPILRLENG